MNFEEMAKALTFGTEVFQSAVSILGYAKNNKDCSPKDRTITLDEVSWHDTPSDCWVIIYDRVYDISDFLDEVNINYQPQFFWKISKIFRLVSNSFVSSF